MPSTNSAEPRLAVYFREDQYFRHTRAWYALLAGALVFGGLIGLLALRRLQGGAFGDAIVSNSVYVLLVALLILGYGAIIVLFGLLRLQVEVNERGIYLRFYPLQRKLRQLDLDGVNAVSAVDYQPTRDYGGHGLKYAPQGKAYTVRGRRGVRIEYDNGHHLLIGSQHADALGEAIARLLEREH